MNKIKKISIGLTTIAVVVAIMAFSLSASAQDTRTPAAQQSGPGVRPAVVTPAQDRTFEQLTSFGFNPQSRELAATVEIKLLGAFYNNFEYVSIWVDWNSDGLFEPNELAGISDVFATNSIPNFDVNPPYTHVVLIKANPPPGSPPAGHILNATAILSFGIPITSPTDVPVFGNVLKGKIKVDPIN